MACVLVNTACKNAFSCFFLLFWVVDVYIALHISFLPLRRARVTFDTSETQKVFGPIVIDYHQVCTISLHLLFGLETENSFRSRTGCIYDTNPCEAMPYIFEVGCVPWGNKYLFSGFKVQSKVNMKYDTWHKEILSKFASRLGDNMQDFYGSVSKVILHFLFFFLLQAESGCVGYPRIAVRYFTILRGTFLILSMF